MQYSDMNRQRKIDVKTGVNTNKMIIDGAKKVYRKVKNTPGKITGMVNNALDNMQKRIIASEKKRYNR